MPQKYKTGELEHVFSYYAYSLEFHTTYEFRISSASLQMFEMRRAIIAKCLKGTVAPVYSEACIAVTLSIVCYRDNRVSSSGAVVHVAPHGF